MLREFKEYRPYKSMEQFRREIGKYVSKQEVARLERYVTAELTRRFAPPPVTAGASRAEVGGV
jgi:hypothetical protein